MAWEKLENYCEKWEQFCEDVALIKSLVGLIPVLGVGYEIDAVYAALLARKYGEWRKALDDLQDKLMERDHLTSLYLPSLVQSHAFSQNLCHSKGRSSI